MFAAISEATTVGPPTKDPIHLVTQFYMPSDPARHEEIQEALRRNAANPHLASITLLNERVYTDEELGTTSSKIKQRVIGHRALFSEMFVDRVAGYTVVANADIYLDESIANVRTSDLHKTRKVYSLLRYEANGQLFGPRADSADTWIVHCNNALALHELGLFRFEMGQPGCDNKICYLFSLLGFKIYNDPLFIKTHHCHAAKERAYGASVPPPYMYIAPAGVACPQFGQSPEVIQDALRTYGWDGNERLGEYLRTRTKPFVIPRVAGIENHAAMLGYYGNDLSEQARQVLKNNTGLSFETKESVRAYASHYLAAFEKCEVYASWEPWGKYVKHIRESQGFIQKKFVRPQFGAFVLDIFNYAANDPWTRALAGKRILLVSPFVDQFNATAYPVDLFPGCTFVHVKPPMTQGGEPSRGWQVEFKELCEAVSKVEFDVALCSCGGYGNPLCAYIYSMGRSAIYVGGVLQMYFGVYGQRWLREQKDATNLYLTAEWTRPAIRPKGHESIENGCYW